jgi:hypothetical protein
MYRWAALILCVAVLAGCMTRPVPVPQNVRFGGAARLPKPSAALPAAPPRILAAWFSASQVSRPGTWAGRIVTTTNAASLEVRSNLFSIDVPRSGFGTFAFTLRVLDVPPIFVRAYRVRIIARNAAGVQSEEDFPFRIR